ncbi:MAG: multifunctional CCA addition/repair protein [Rhodocyclaceae bacterium]|jgi:tRNA nucleotidyltransferase (CCA-adding enzyme)|nr:multifunctional CCA addition/repair protein [Rhodocyclaceae bacterium]
MQIFEVGGAVRDELLGLPVQDRDYVVVGGTPEEMVARGYRPVGKDFPVFLHPVTHAEYALARTERKTGPGYKGFAFHADPAVRLEEDLLRRDLTINAMARGADGKIVDPFGGQADLQQRVLRHVSPAFAEDPVRILRVARFTARFTDFMVAPETLQLMALMVANGEVDHLVPERVWQELARGLMESQPARMIRLLRACGALARLLPELDALFGVPQPAAWHGGLDAGEHTLAVVDCAAIQGAPLAVRWACLLHDLGKGVSDPANHPHHYGHEATGAELARALSDRCKAPVDCRDLAVLVAREHGVIHRAAELRPATVVDLLERCDALRRPERFELLLEACAWDWLPRPGRAGQAYAPGEILARARAAAAGVDAGAVARGCADKARIAEAVRLARIDAVRGILA